MKMNDRLRKSLDNHFENSKSLGEPNRSDCWLFKLLEMTKQNEEDHFFLKWKYHYLQLASYCWQTVGGKKPVYPSTGVLCIKMAALVVLFSFVGLLGREAVTRWKNGRRTSSGIQEDGTDDVEAPLLPSVVDKTFAYEGQWTHSWCFNIPGYHDVMCTASADVWRWTTNAFRF